MRRFWKILLFLLLLISSVVVFPPGLTLGITDGVAVVESPPSGEVSILIEAKKMRLTVEVNGEAYKSYPVALGTKKTPTPIGEWKIVEKGANWGEGFGSRWLGLNVPWGTYGIHGTNKPWLIGGRASHGCIRMRNSDVEKVYPLVGVGTRVRIVGSLPNVKAGRNLKLGQYGQDVVAVQLALRKAGVFAGYADGRFGPETELAVGQLELLNYLPIDGRVDAEVRKILAEYAAGQRAAVALQ